MSDLSYKVEVKKGDQSGLDAVKQKIKDLKKEVKELEASISKETAAEKAAAAAQKTAASETAKAAAKKREILEAVDRLAGRIPGLGGAFSALKTVITGLSFAGIIGGLTFLIQMGAIVYAKFFAPMIEGAKKSKEAIKEWLGAATSIEGVLNRQAAAAQRIDAVAKAYDAAAKAADKLAQAQAKLEDARAQRAIDAMPEGPAKEQAKRDLAAAQLDRSAAAIPMQQEREQYRVQVAEAGISSMEQTLALIGDKLGKAIAENGIKSDQQKAIDQAQSVLGAKHNRSRAIANYTAEMGVTPQDAIARAKGDMAAGNLSYNNAGDSGGAKKVREAAEEYADLTKQIADAKNALGNLKTEVDANVAALGMEADAIKEQKAGIDAARQAEIDAAWEKANADEDGAAIAGKEQRDKDRDAEEGNQRDKRERAAEDARAMAFDEADPEDKRKMIAEDIAGLVTKQAMAKAEGRTGDADLIGNQIARKRKDLAGIKDAEDVTAGSGKEGIDEFIDDFAAAGGRMPKRMAGSKMAKSFRSSLGKSGFGDLGKSFSASLQTSAFAKPGEGTGPLEDNPAKLQREGNATLKRIETKLGMRE